MRAFCIAVIASGVAILAGALLAAVRADEATYIAGDSHCVALAQIANLPSVARNGAPTREVVSQLRRLPAGATVIVCAGTNDAAARLAGFQTAVGAVLATAKAQNQKLIWIGPIRAPAYWWDGYSDQADTFLALTVPNYVSMRAIGFPDKERSGFHLTPNGYARLWAIVKGKL